MSDVLSATNYLSLATAAFFGLGAYVTAWSLQALPGRWWCCWADSSRRRSPRLSAPRSCICAAPFAVLTFGLGELVRHAITYFEKSYAGTVGRVLTVTPDAATVYLTVLVIAMAAVCACALVRASRLGLALEGIGADEERAQTLGVNTRRVKIAAFALSAFFAGALGAAMAVRWTYIDPPAVFNAFIGFQTVLIAMVGGAQTIIGPLVSRWYSACSPNSCACSFRTCS